MKLKKKLKNKKMIKFLKKHGIINVLH